MICCSFIFKPGTYDDEFRLLDGVIEHYARSLPGFVKVENWRSVDGTDSNAMYFFTDMDAVDSSLASPPTKKPSAKPAAGTTATGSSSARSPPPTATATSTDTPAIGPEMSVKEQAGCRSMEISGGRVGQAPVHLFGPARPGPGAAWPGCTRFGSPRRAWRA